MTHRLCPSRDHDPLIVYNSGMYISPQVEHTESATYLPSGRMLVFLTFIENSCPSFLMSRNDS